MTLDGVINAAAQKMPHTYERSIVIGWINALEGRIQLNVFGGCLDETVVYTEDTDGSTELIVRPPHDDIYELWVRAQICAANGEWDEYANATEMYNAAYADYVRWFAEYYGTHKRRCGDPPHYLSAYGVAVKNGFVGTPEEWLASLVGPQGPVGPQGEDGPRGVQGPIGPQGVSGVYVGSGDMPEGYNVQVDPTGDAAVRMTVGSVVTLPEGAEATAEITGTPEAPVLNLGIPRGAKGSRGEQGDSGPQGEIGPAPSIGIGSVDVSATGAARVYITKGADGKILLNLVVPQGEQGERGLNGADGADGKDGANGLTPYIGANGNWWIGDADTGTKVQGEKGEPGEAGKDLTDKPWVLLESATLKEAVTAFTFNLPANTYKEVWVEGEWTGSTSRSVAMSFCEPRSWHNNLSS